MSLGTAAKNELLFNRGINFNDVPTWQRRGTGVVWEAYIKQSRNPVTGATVSAARRRLGLVHELPIKDEYRVWLQALLTDGSS